MYNDLVVKISDVAISKSNLMKKSLGRYLFLSAMAGIYVGLGIILIFTVGGSIGDSPYKKILMGVSFGIALSLVIAIGSELFTGNNFVMIIGALDKKVKWMDAIKIWVYSYIGNFIGSFLLAFVYVNTGLVKGPLADFIKTVSAGKMNALPMELFLRGVLCNLLVCLAVFAALKMKEETAKLIMVFWCLYAFITAGFEHSVANMTLLSISLLIPHGSDISVMGLINNLVFVSLGNFVGGGLILGLGYWYAGNKK